MDTDAYLMEMRRLANRIAKQLDGDKPVAAADVDRLCELVLTLDEWLRRGGQIR